MRALQRREVLAGAAGVTAGATVSIRTAQALPADHEVLALVADVRRILADMKRLEREPVGAFGSTRQRANEAAFGCKSAELNDALYALADAQAVTARGLAAKARLVTELLPSAVFAYEVNEDTAEVRLALSLARDAGKLSG